MSLKKIKHPLKHRLRRIKVKNKKEEIAENFKLLARIRCKKCSSGLTEKKQVYIDIVLTKQIPDKIRCYNCDGIIDLTQIKPALKKLNKGVGDV